MQKAPTFLRVLSLVFWHPCLSVRSETWPTSLNLLTLQYLRWLLKPVFCIRTAEDRPRDVLLLYYPNHALYERIWGTTLVEL